MRTAQRYRALLQLLQFGSIEAEVALQRSQHSPGVTIDGHVGHVIDADAVRTLLEAAINVPPGTSDIRAALGRVVRHTEDLTDTNTALLHQQWALL